MEPDISKINAKLILKRWEEVGRPNIDHPAASRTTKSVGLIGNLDEWIRIYEPNLHELAYVGQQLWPDYADFLWEMNMAELLGNIDFDE